MPKKVLSHNLAEGIRIHQAFVAASKQQSPVVVKLGSIPWPSGLAPQPAALGNYKAGQTITGALNAKADALIILYTETETQALLDVFTGDNEWSASRRKQWCAYAHNFAKFKPKIGGIGGSAVLKLGLFGYLSAVKIGPKTVVLFKSELHPKEDGTQLPFIGVIQQLVSELNPTLVISTGTAGAIGSAIQCGDVAIASSARFHLADHYPAYPDLNLMSANHDQLTNAATVNPQYVNYAATHLTQLSQAGLSQCHSKLQALGGFSFVKASNAPPKIYVTGTNPVPPPQPMDVVSADYMTVDDQNNSEGLESLGMMNETDDAFAFYAINNMKGKKPKWLSVRNASEPQIDHQFPSGTSSAAVSKELGNLGGTIYAIYQYCTTLNSAFACWGVVAGM